MSITKHFYWQEICANYAEFDEAEYFAGFEEIDETQIDWFPEYRLASDGYEEIELPEDKPAIIDEDLPF